jgi:hypothetical protein
MAMPKGHKNPNAGRPLFNGKPEEAVLLLLRQAWSLDCPDSEAAALAGISPSALSEYLSRNPKIAEEKEALKLKPFLSARNTIIKGIVEGDKDTARWYLERKRKREFSTLQQHEVGEQGSFRDLTDDELDQIIAGKKKPADFLGLEKKP